MTTPWSQPYRLMIILIVVIGILTGCASVIKRFDDKMHRKRFKSDYQAFENAVTVYDEGDFEKALTRFKALSTASASEKIARKAWLGEVCCRLMVANTHEKYTAAVGMWHEFGESLPEDDTAVDIALLDPLITRITPENTTRVIGIQPPAASITAETDRSADRQPDDRRLQVELADLKKKVEKATQLKIQMEKIVAENQSLKEKIKALEAIDHDIQRKKTKILAPSE